MISSANGDGTAIPIGGGLSAEFGAGGESQGTCLHGDGGTSARAGGCAAHLPCASQRDSGAFKGDRTAVGGAGVGVEQTAADGDRGAAADLDRTSWGRNCSAHLHGGVGPGGADLDRSSRGRDFSAHHNGVIGPGSEEDGLPLLHHQAAGNVEPGGVAAELQARDDIGVDLRRITDDICGRKELATKIEGLGGGGLE